MPDDPIKDALKRIPYGFYAITSRAGDDRNAMVANWLTQISYEPRQVAVGVQTTSYSRALIEQGGAFVVNIFLQTDAEAIKPYTKGRAKNPQKMENATYSPSLLTGCPVLAGAAAYLECRVVAIHETGGDHSLVVGEVIGAEILKPGEAGDTLNLPALGWSYAG